MGEWFANQELVEWLQLAVLLLIGWNTALGQWSAADIVSALGDIYKKL